MKKTVWALTYEVNDYSQHGEYLAAVWLEKPTRSELLMCLYEGNGDNESYSPCSHKRVGELLNKGRAPDAGTLVEFLLLEVEIGKLYQESFY